MSLSYFTFWKTLFAIILMFESIVLCRNYQGQLITEKGKATKSGEKVIITINYYKKWPSEMCNISIALHQQQCNRTDYLPNYSRLTVPLPSSTRRTRPSRTRGRSAPSSWTSPVGMSSDPTSSTPMTHTVAPKSQRFNCKTQPLHLTDCSVFTMLSVRRPQQNHQ